LPDEPLDVSAVPADVHDRVQQVVALTDALADEPTKVGASAYADTAQGPTMSIGDEEEHGPAIARELRTARRRCVAGVAASDPQLFRRRGRVETAAAAVVWAVGRASRLAGAAPAPIPSGEMHA
jgi:hypothetical protein